jgi:hypothetical protein
MIHSAAAALAAYPAMRSDTATNIRDLLTDLMHYCDARGVNFTDELRTAQANYRNEVEADRAIGEQV